MMRVEAIIRPERAKAVLDHLSRQGIYGVTAYEVRGSGRQKGFAEHYRGLELQSNVLPKVKLEIVVKDYRVEEVIEAIKASARTGHVGDGMIFLSPVADVVRIRTGERGEGILLDVPGLEDEEDGLPDYGGAVV